ncbi:MAG: methyl-accepting chemotaxis protein [Geminicoccaceae bacterium]
MPGAPTTYAELGTGTDEIGDIGRAIEVFRQNTLALERNADLEARRRRRQARFIRRQMMTLSETLDEEAQASAIEDLRHIETAVADGSPLAQDGTRFSDELGLIGVALERMTARVRSQQQALSELIDELREALEMKTRLISLEQELDIARQMQQNVLPRRFPDTPGLRDRCRDGAGARGGRRLLRHFPDRRAPRRHRRCRRLGQGHPGRLLHADRPHPAQGDRPRRCRARSHARPPQRLSLR